MSKHDSANADRLHSSSHSHVRGRGSLSRRGLGAPCAGERRAGARPGGRNGTDVVHGRGCHDSLPPLRVG
ncbi:hypothetical protein C6A85_10835, partial [Mycobacterium sp. ITM-2017-0098]